MNEAETKYACVSIETARTGWVVKEKGRHTEIFVRWEAVVKYIGTRLTSEDFDDLEGAR